MTNSKNTKRALLASALSVVLCCAMLIGSTFAWFTDSVTSGNNKIIAGNLKVDLIHVDDGKEVSIKDTPSHKIFDYDKWEPGYTVMETLKVVNKGNLALKFRLDAVAAGATAAPTGEKLADVIDVHVYEGDGIPTPASFADMTEANGWRKAGSLSALMADPDGIARGVLLPEKETATESEPAGSVQMTVALHMQEGAGNAYQGLTLGSLNFILNATQYTYEEDAFDDQYDAGAAYDDRWDGTVDTSWYEEGKTEFTLTTAEQFAGMAELLEEANGFSGKTIKLENNLNLDNIAWTPIGTPDNPFTGTFDGNHYTIRGLNITGKWERSGLFGQLIDGTVKNLTLSGSIDVESAYAGAIAGYAEGLIENCVSYVDVTSSSSETRCYAGGIAGASTKDIIACVNYGSVSSTGMATNTVDQTGGIAGYLWAYYGDQKIENCENHGQVTSSSKYISEVGGIVGALYGYDGHDAVIVKSSNTGTVSAIATENTNRYYAGGIAGYTEGALIKIENSLNQGTVSFDIRQDEVSNAYYHFFGGIVGFASQGGTIQQSVNAGTLHTQYDNAASCEIFMGGIVASGAGVFIDRCVSYGNFDHNLTTDTTPQYIQVGAILGREKYNDTLPTMAGCVYNSDTGAGCVGTKSSVSPDATSLSLSMMLHSSQIISESCLNSQVWTFDDNGYAVLK